MYQENNVYMAKQQADELVDSIISSQRASYEMLTYAHSIEAYTTEAIQAHYGIVAKESATIFQSNIEDITTATLSIPIDIKHMLHAIKLAYFNAQWAHRAAMQHAQSTGMIVAMPAIIEQYLQNASSQISSIDTFEKLINRTDTDSITKLIHALKYCMYHVSAVVHSIKIFENTFYGLPAKSFACEAEKNIAEAFVKELAIARHARNILWRTAVAQKYSPAGDPPAQLAEQRMDTLVDNAQALHIG
jgi:hypothetical protein